ncbi:MAG: SDR family oxidoreductase, partial [Actinomycetota bacterium]|nr:SDR family oxidoreductase [Actinomycetota bacterium]
TATVFAQEGASVAITGRRREPLDLVAERTGAMAIPGDTSSRQGVEAAIRATVDNWGHLDVVVANAGIGSGGSAGEVSDESWQRTLDVNLTGAMFLVRAALPHLVRRPGAAIVLVSSVSGFLSAPRSVAYEVSKSGLLALMRSVALDYGPLGVRCNAVCPGWIRTPMGDASAREIAAERGITVDDAYTLLDAPVPLRRPGMPEEVARCCAFLASDEASYVNGCALIVDGGGSVVDVASLPWSSPTKEETTS